MPRSKLLQKQQALAKINELVQNCQKCPLYKTAIQGVPGEGNPNADIFFVGEAPGRNEDIQGRPFVGASGKFLDELISLIGLKREDVFIGNMVKHRPPGNRDPEPNELHACTPWLEKQLEIIQPKLIVTLGRFGMAYFLGTGFTISQVHGQPKRRKGQVVLPMYHPAAALYRGQLKDVMRADFKKIPKLLKLIKEDA